MTDRTLTKLVFGLAVLLLVALGAARAQSEPTWTVYDPTTCTITVTGSGRTDFQITRGGTAEVYILEGHSSVTLDVNEMEWSVAVMRSGQGWVTVASGPATSCNEAPPESTTTTTEVPEGTTTTTTEAPSPEPPVTTTTIPGQPDDEGNCGPGLELDPSGKACFVGAEGGGETG